MNDTTLNAVKVREVRLSPLPLLADLILQYSLFWAKVMVEREDRKDDVVEVKINHR